jgi:hypothetical protein
MRSFGHMLSIMIVSMASRPLRTKLRPDHRNRFFATCWVMVLAPRSLWPRSCARTASRIDLKSKPA